MLNRIGSIFRVLVLLFVVAGSFAPSVAYASSSACGGNATGNASCFSASSSPWDQSTQNLTGLLTGAPAKAISIVAIVVAGVALVFGEDLGAFAKRLLMVVIAVAMILGAGSIIATVFGATV